MRKLKAKRKTKIKFHLKEGRLNTLLKMKVIALSFKVDDDVNSVIASFVGTTPSKTHPLTKIMKPLIQQITDLYGKHIIDGYVPSEEWDLLVNDDPEDDEFLNFANCALPWIKNKELWFK